MNYADESAAVIRARLRAQTLAWTLPRNVVDTIPDAELRLYAQFIDNGDDSLELALRLRARNPTGESLPLTIPEWVAALRGATKERKQELWALAPESTKTALKLHKQRLAA